MRSKTFGQHFVRLIPWRSMQRCDLTVAVDHSETGDLAKRWIECQAYAIGDKVNHVKAQYLSGPGFKPVA